MDPVPCAVTPAVVQVHKPDKAQTDTKQLSGLCCLVWFHQQKCPCPEECFMQGNSLRGLQIPVKQNWQTLLLAIYVD